MSLDDRNGNGVYDPGMMNRSESDRLTRKSVIISGQDPDVSFISGVFQSFGDAPGGFREELKEFT